MTYYPREELQYLSNCEPDRTWYVLQVMSGTERAVAVILMMNGVHVICPTETKHKRVGRGGKARRKSVEVPKLRGYVLAGFTYPRWPAILGLTNVYGVLSSGGEPLSVRPDRIADWMDSIEVDPDTAPGMDEVYQWSPGESAMVRRGPWTDLSAVVEWADKEQAGIIVEMLGRSHSVTVPIEVLTR